MYRLTRCLLIYTVLGIVYCVSIMVVMIPWTAIIVAIALAVAGKRRREFSAFGTARWADALDLRYAGMLDAKNGLTLGYVQGSQSKKAGIRGLFNRKIPAKEACQSFLDAFRKTPAKHWVCLNRTPHIACFAPTGVGKGTSCITPFLMTCNESCVVIDTKGGRMPALPQSTGADNSAIGSCCSILSSR